MMKKTFTLYFLLSFTLNAQVSITTTTRNTNSYINGYCNELWQWSKQQQYIDINSQPFKNNFLSLNPKFGTFNNAMANTHSLLTTGGVAYNYTICRPYPTSTLFCTTSTVTCSTPSNCSCDGLGCFTPSLTNEFYDISNSFYASNNIALAVNVNPYVSNWSSQKLYISKPLSQGVNVIAICAGNELIQPSWYANCYFFPNAGISYRNYFNKLYDSCSVHYPTIPLLTWIGDLWITNTNSIYYKWNNSVKSDSGGLYNGVHAYAQTRDIKNSAFPSVSSTLNQLIDSVLSFKYWLNSWMQKKDTIFGIGYVGFDTYGTNPEEPVIGKSCLGDLQTAYQQMCFQLYTGNSNILYAQEYRTRSYNLQSSMTGTSYPVQQYNLRRLRGEIYAPTVSKIATISTTNTQVVGMATYETNGNINCLFLNFTNIDYPITNFTINNQTVTSTYTVEGYQSNNLIDTLNGSWTYYTGGNQIKARSMSLIKLNSSIVNNVPENFLVKRFTVYPNPGSNLFYIKGEVNTRSIKILDITGRQISIKTHQISNEIIQVETKEIVNGIYLMLINNEETNEMHRIIIHH